MENCNQCEVDSQNQDDSTGELSVVAILYGMDVAYLKHVSPEGVVVRAVVASHGFRRRDLNIEESCQRRETTICVAPSHQIAATVKPPTGTYFHSMSSEAPHDTHPWEDDAGGRLEVEDERLEHHLLKTQHTSTHLISSIFTRTVGSPFCTDVQWATMPLGWCSCRTLPVKSLARLRGWLGEKAVWIRSKKGPSTCLPQIKHSTSAHSETQRTRAREGSKSKLHSGDGITGCRL